MQRFVFLEFTDSRVRTFLSDLRSALEGKSLRKPIHITVRGPYLDLPDPRLLETLDEGLQGRGVVIGGAGTFETDKGLVVYMKAQSPVFDEIWWKPDFPKETYGIRPHITIFETQESRKAKSVESFLRKERIEIFTFGLRLSVYSSKQLNLFDVDLKRELMKERALWERWKVKPGILGRASRLRETLGQV